MSLNPLGVSSAIRKGMLLKTGQTTEYGSGTGMDDGFYERGLTRSYTVLTTGQYSGSTNITINAKTDAHSNNCVYDNNTTLMWSRNVAASVGPTSNGLLPWTTNGSGEGIFTYVAAANVALLSGYSDWRIPNYMELLSLVNVVTLVPDSIAFPSFPVASSIWSSTTRNAVTTNAIQMSFSNGLPGFTIKTTTYNTILVRGGI